VKILEKIQRTLSLILKELELLIKDRQALLIIFLLPVLVILALGFSNMNFGGTDDFDNSIIIGMVDLDTSSGWPGEDLSYNFTTYLQQKTVVVFYTSEQYQQNRQWLDLEIGNIDGYIIIPENFEFYVSISEIPAYLNLTLDATNVVAQAKIISAITDALADFKIDHNLTRDEVLPLITYEWYSDAVLFTSAAAVFSVAIFGSTLMTSAQSIVGDVPLRRMLLTPARKTEVIFAKLIAYLVIGIIQIVLLLLISILGFGLPIIGNYQITMLDPLIGPVIGSAITTFTLFLLLLTLAFTGICMGLLISVISKTRLQASQYFLLVFILMFVLSWFVSSEFFSQVLPLPVAQASFNEIAFKGFTILQAGQSFLTLFIFGSVCLALCMLIFYFKKHVV